jgi:hypothetical protein
MKRYFLQLRCPAGHETETELLHAVVTEDGMVEGAAGSDSDYCRVCEQEPTAYAVREETGLCEWVLLCDNDATTTRSHPILGDVPICKRCNARAESLAHA